MEKYILWLMLLDCTNLQKIKLLKIFSDEKEIFENFEEIIKAYLNRYKTISEVDKFNLLEKATVLNERLKELGISFMSIKDRRYPISLKKIAEPPYLLFYRGNIDLLSKRTVGIVGSRKNSIYGERATRLIAKELVKNNIAVVSGGALGVDSIAHDETLKNGGNTIAVLGCGIDIAYPYRNKNLFKAIEKDGLVISEFLPGTKPYAYNFPRRNRIISGLSEIIVVTEATEKSGSLITVTCALEQGKDVIVVPQPIFSKSGYGANLLIRDGANIYSSMEDLYMLLKIDLKNNDSKVKYIKNEVLDIINDEPMHIDDIFTKSQVDRNTLYGLLFELQTKNEIISLPGNYYVRVT
ncbi:DNA-processing protein DprA [Clostridium sp.]|uniref:DNA-processing protein DprA n=1 Tax=Clostridium sp. TaxID=1506 RepID=UPI002FC97D9F